MYVYRSYERYGMCNDEIKMFPSLWHVRTLANEGISRCSSFRLFLETRSSDLKESGLHSAKYRRSICIEFAILVGE